MKDDISEYLHRPKRYDNIDGTGEIFMGLMLLGFALIGYLQRHMPEQSFWMRHGLLFMYAVLVPVLGLGFAIQKLVKRNITFPRTGYVALGSAERPVATKMKGWIYGAILGGVFGVIGAVIFVPLLLVGKAHPVSLNVARSLYAAIFVGVYGFWIARMGQGQQWKWGALGLMMVAMLAAAILVPVQGGFDPFFPWSALVAGAGWVLSGTITLFVYLCHHHVAAVEQ